jgi:hypothetical protein
MFQIILAALIELVSFAVGAVIFWRRSYELIALVVAFFLVGFASDINNNLEALAVVQPAWILPVRVVSYSSSIIFPFVFYLFPDGRFVPRWIRWLAFGTAILYGPSFFFPGSALDVKAPQFVTLSTMFFIGLWFSFIVVQIYRYLRISTPVQRQQTKWVVFGVSIALLGLAVIAVSDQTVNQPQNVLDLLNGALAYFLFFLVPISFGIAILRYRLWDVDVLINKALVYGLLTVMLSALYAGLIIAIEGITGAITGPKSQQPLILVISTLVIAALFTPLRKRLQNFIDRRFYRRKYDAARTLETFSAAARHEVELGKLSDRLLTAAGEAMQPQNIFLWLKPAANGKPQGTEPVRKA